MDQLCLSLLSTRLAGHVSCASLRPQRRQPGCPGCLSRQARAAMHRPPETKKPKGEPKEKAPKLNFDKYVEEKLPLKPLLENMKNRLNVLHVIKHSRESTI